MHEERLARGKAPTLEGVVPDGEEGLGYGRGRDRRQVGRDRQRVAFMREAVFGVTAADDERHDLVAILPAGGPGPARDDFAGDFEPGNIGGARGRRIKAHPLHDVGPVDAGGGDLDQNLAGARRRRRALLRDQNVRSARRADRDDRHAVWKRCHGKAFKRGVAF